ALVATSCELQREPLGRRRASPNISMRREEKMKTAIEIGNEMISAKQHPMNRNTSELLATLILLRQDMPIPKSVEVPFGMQIVLKRLEWAGVPVENRVALF